MLTYAKVGGPPDYWMFIKIYDLNKKCYVENVVECNAAQHWLIRFVDDTHTEKEMLSGDFEIQRHEINPS